jgi:hypothetical protein
MNDARTVSVGQSGAGPLDHLNPLRQGQGGPATNQAADRLTRDVLHRDEGSVSELACLEHGDDVRVLQAPGRARLTQQPPAPALGLEPAADQFDRDHAIDDRIASEVDVPHAASTEQFRDLESADSLGESRRGETDRSRTGL